MSVSQSVSQSISQSVTVRPHATDLPAQTAHSAGKNHTFDFICVGLQDCRATIVQMKVSVGVAKVCSDVSAKRSAPSICSVTESVSG